MTPRLPTLLLLGATLLGAAASGCGTQGAGPRTPEAKTTPELEALAHLRSIPDEVQAEVDLVLQPIADAELVIDQITSMPQTLGLDADGLRRMAAASLASTDAISVELDVGPETEAEVEAVLRRIQGVGAGLRQTPERAKAATATISALGVEATQLVTKLTATYETQLSDPRLQAEDRARIQADLDLVLGLDADIEATVANAEQTVTSLPARGEEALAELTTAFSGGSSTHVG